MTEQWKPVAGYEGYYEVSSEGRVRSLARGRNRRTGQILRPSLDRKGYHVINLCRDGRQKQHKVHRLVALAFHGPSDLLALHGDGNPDNNTVGNIRWGTPLENNDDRRRHGRARNQNTNKTHCIRGHELTPDNIWLCGAPEHPRRHCKRCRANRKPKGTA